MLCLHTCRECTCTYIHSLIYTKIPQFAKNAKNSIFKTSKSVSNKKKILTNLKQLSKCTIRPLRHFPYFPPTPSSHHKTTAASSTTLYTLPKHSHSSAIYSEESFFVPPPTPSKIIPTRRSIRPSRRPDLSAICPICRLSDFFTCDYLREILVLLLRLASVEERHRLVQLRVA